MSWGNLDDQSTFHPKIVRAGNAAWGAVCRMIAWSKAHGTDGVIPEVIAKLIATPAELDAAFEANLLEMREGGYAVHDFLDWNDSARKVESLRNKRKNAGHLGGLKRAANAVAKGKQVLKQTASKGVGLDLGSGSDPEGESEREAGPLVEVVPGNAANEAEQVPTREDAYREAYERGVAKGKGGPYAMPREQQGHLHQAIKAFAKGGRTGRVFRGDELLEWIAVLAEEFAEHVVRHKDERAVGWYSGYGPKGFLKYLNEQATRRAEREVG